MAVAHRDVAGLLRKHGYRELKKIGEGSFGKAVLVQSESTDVRLVCKMVDVSQASQREVQDAVKEGRLLAAFRHPYVVRYRESFIESGWLCILMDFCEGGDLTKQIESAKKRGQHIPEELILRWITQALLALKYIHEKHVLHRDLKSGNFFLSKSGNLKMGDFGIAKVLSCTLACAKTQIGTPYYLSPEVCQEKPYAWPSDIWAMGCILYELCALKVPFDAPNISGLVQKICRGPTPLIPSGYSDFLRQLCGEMLSRSPSNRPSAESILQRPQIQAIVKQMLEQAQSAQQEANAGATATSDSERASAAPTPTPASATPGREEQRAAYRKGDLVEYWSNTHKDWLPATVINVDADGRLVIDLKPNTWIPPELQAACLRPRRRPVSDHVTPPAAAAAPAPGPPIGLRQRSPSMPGLRAPSPGPRYELPGSVVGSRAGTPSRGAWRREPSPAAQVPSRAGTPNRGGVASRGQSPQGYKPARGPTGVPAGVPRRPGAPMVAPSGHSPAAQGLRPCRVAGAAGMAIAGGIM